MYSSRLPVFWVCGAVGAGKSVTAWALFEALADAGVTVAYVDIDQLGMLYPAADTDPQRHLLKTHALVSLVPGYLAAGAQVLVVSGVINAEAGPERDSVAPVDFTLCLISPTPDSLRGRILARGSGQDAAEEAVAEDAALRRATFIDVVVETAGLTVSQAAARLRQFVTVAEPSPAPTAPVASSATTAVVLVTGPRAAGLSTLGFGLAMTRWRAGHRTGFVDLQQLAFLAAPTASNSTRSALAIRQFATMHEYMTGRGARLLVATGHLSTGDLETLTDYIPRGRVTVIRIRADTPTLRAHVRERIAGSAARLAGDDLAGAGYEHQQAVIAQAIADQEHLDAHAHDDAVVDVTGRSPADVIDEIERLIAGAR